MQKQAPHVEKTTKRKEDTCELESQFILRLPPHPAHQLRNAVRSGAMNLKDRMSVELQSDMRNATVRFDGMIFSGKLVDLPCVIESHKTIDRKTFYKTADISQMLICKDTFDDLSLDDSTPGKKKDKRKEDKKYMWNHGITPPLKNVRKRRFRKTAKKKYVEQPDIEKEVKALFKLDNEAVRVRYEIVTEDQDKKESVHLSSGEAINTSLPSQSNESSTNPLDVAISDIFGEAVSSSDEEAEVNVLVEDDESNLGQSQPSDFLAQVVTETVGEENQDDFQDNEQVDDDDDDDDNLDIEAGDEISNMSTQSVSDSQARLETLEQELRDIRERRRVQEVQVDTTENLGLKERLQTALDELIEEEKAKEEELQQATASLQGGDNESFL